MGWQWTNSKGEKVEIRIDFDPKNADKGAHYNWKVGGKKGAVLFDATQEQVDRIIKNEIVKSEL